MIDLSDFLGDRTGATFSDVVGDARIRFQDWLDFFNDAARRVRMKDSEIHHLRPALSGVVRELENHPAFSSFLSGQDAHTTTRGRQAIGVIARLVMEQEGWRKTGRKGSLGQRPNIAPGTTAPGAYRNSSGLSQWFTRAEHYMPPDGLPYSNPDRSASRGPQAETGVTFSAPAIR